MNDVILVTHYYAAHRPHYVLHSNDSICLFVRLSHAFDLL